MSIDVALDKVLHAQISDSNEEVESSISHCDQGILGKRFSRAYISALEETEEKEITLEKMMVSPLLMGIMNLAKTMPAIQAWKYFRRV